MHRKARVICLVDGRERRAPVHRGQPARVAVGKHVHPALAFLALLCGFDETPFPPCVLADGPVDGHVLVAEVPGAPERGGHALGERQRAQHPAHLIKGPAQVHRRGSGGLEQRVWSMMPTERASGSTWRVRLG